MLGKKPLISRGAEISLMVEFNFSQGGAYYRSKFNFCLWCVPYCELKPFVAIFLPSRKYGPTRKYGPICFFVQHWSPSSE